MRMKRSVQNENQLVAAELSLPGEVVENPSLCLTHSNVSMKVFKQRKLEAQCFIYCYFIEHILSVHLEGWTVVVAWPLSWRNASGSSVRKFSVLAKEHRIQIACTPFQDGGSHSQESTLIFHSEYQTRNVVWGFHIWFSVFADWKETTAKQGLWEWNRLQRWFRPWPWQRTATHGDLCQAERCPCRTDVSLHQQEEAQENAAGDTQGISSCLVRGIECYWRADYGMSFDICWWKIKHVQYEWLWGDAKSYEGKWQSITTYPSLK